MSTTNKTGAMLDDPEFKILRQGQEACDGSPRMTEELQDRGHAGSENRVARPMRARPAGTGRAAPGAPHHRYKSPVAFAAQFMNNQRSTKGSSALSPLFRGNFCSWFVGSPQANFWQQ